MANASILAAFERMWQHIVISLSGKSDTSHNHNDAYDTLGAADVALHSARDYVDSAKNEILDNAPIYCNTLKKASDSIDDIYDKIEPLYSLNIDLDCLGGVTSNVQTQLDGKMNTTNPVATGSFSMNRKADTDIGMYSHAEGFNTTASGWRSHAEGLRSEAQGGSSHAEGGGCKAIGSCSHAEGSDTLASGDYSHAEGSNTESLSCQHAQGHYNNTATATEGCISGISSGTAFVIGNGLNNEGTLSLSNAFRVTYEGKPYSRSSMVTTGADYAEFFEWQDLNPDSEDRRGYFVTLDGEKIKIAEPDDYVLGIVSGRPAIIGNGDEDWQGRYIHDEFGDFIIEEFQYEEKILNEETDETIIVTKIGAKYKENPDYNSSLPYVQREARPEWDAVGMVGALSVRDDGTCEVNGYCKVTNGGIATASEEGYRVIKRINENIVKVILK